MANDFILAPDGPGIPPRWTSSAKTGVGSARNMISHVWFTLSHGIFNEVYFPRVDQANIRDMGHIVTDGSTFFSEEKRDCKSEVEYLVPGVPAYRIVNTCNQGRYRIEKEIIADPRRSVVLQRTRFVPLIGELKDYKLYTLLSPHLGNCGYGNTAWVGDYKGQTILCAERHSLALALASSHGWLRGTAGFAGTSDGWQDLNQNKQLTWKYNRAENGNVALTGEIDLAGCQGAFVLALGFGTTYAEAGHRAVASIHDGFGAALDDYVEAWQAWQRDLLPLDRDEDTLRDLYRVSTAVLRLHEAKHFPGGTIASLSIPWGFSKSDNDLGGYHLVWPRDQVETAGGFLAAGAKDDARRVLTYLQVTQEADGHWPQNMWLDGAVYWSGIQMDESAFPILLVDMARREAALQAGDLTRLWPMVRRAAGFLVRNGPVTQEDRWEEDAGFSPFTLAVEISALLVAANLAEKNDEPDTAQFLREVADSWNDEIETWTYATDTAMSRAVGVEGYYVRIAPPDIWDASSPQHGFVPIRNRPPDQSQAEAEELVSPDALALVRFGLRSAHDPRIVNTVRVIDHVLKLDTPYGPTWKRYNRDGYGEHEDGSPFDGTGIGRAWPLLTGERAHYELAAGRREEAERLLRAVESFANEGGMIPEQVWDSPDIPEYELYFARPSGSAMPLVWAHGEYIKLRRSLRDGRVFDMPPQTVERYVDHKHKSKHDQWSFNLKSNRLKHGKILRISLLAAATVRWSTDDWTTTFEVETRDTGLGIFVADLPTEKLAVGSKVEFTFHWTEANKWEGTNFETKVE